MTRRDEIEQAINRGDYDGFEASFNRSDLVAAALNSIAAIEGDVRAQRPIAGFEILREAILIVDELEASGVELTEEQRRQHTRRVLESLAAFQAVGGTLTNIAARSREESWADVLHTARRFLDALREEHGGPV